MSLRSEGSQRDGFLRFDWGFWNPKGKASAKPTTMNARTKDEAPSREREEDEIQYGVRRENKNGERAMGVRFNPVKISINKKK